MSRGFGTAQKKVLLLLLGGLALGFSRSPRRSQRIIKLVGNEWKEINRSVLHHAIKGLYRSHLLEGRENVDGTTTFILSEQGRKHALTFKLDEMRLKKPERWDGKWRFVIFDIPERQKRIRDTLRGHLKQLGFYEFQKSVFVHPYPCADELNFLIEFYQIRRHVRVFLGEELDNELHLKKVFNKLIR